MSDKYVIDHYENVEMYEHKENRHRHVRFPVRLAVRYGAGLVIDCSSFVLNVSKGGVFIETDQPLGVGTRIIMHFYIPPKVKLLGEFKARVAWVNTCDRNRPKGMGIVFVDYSRQSMDQLEDLLEEKLHLVDCTD